MPRDPDTGKFVSQDYLDKKMAKDKTAEPAAPAEAPAASSVNWRKGCLLAAVVIMFLGFCLTIFLVGAFFVYQHFSDGGDDRRPPSPGPRPSSSLVEEIERVGVTPEDALKFAKISRSTANILEGDGRARSPVVAERSEAEAVPGNVGQLAVTGNELNRYPEMPRVIKRAFEDVFPTNERGEMEGGELTDTDRDRFIERWREMASAFEEVAQ